MPTLQDVEFEFPACLEAGNVIRGDLWPGRSEMRHFADPVHMNPEGARAFSAWLAHLWGWGGAKFGP